MRLKCKAGIRRREDDGQGPSAEPSTPDISRRGQHGIRHIGLERGKRRNVTAAPRIELRRCQSSHAAVEDRTVIVPIEPHARHELIEGFDIGFRLIAAVTGSGAIQGRLDGHVVSRCAGRDDRLVQNEGAAGGIFVGKVGIFFKPSHTEAQIDPRHCCLQLRHDLREGGPHDGTVVGKTARVIKQQEDVDEIGERPGIRQRDADGLTECLPHSQRRGNTGGTDVPDCGIADPGRPQDAADRIGIRWRVAGVDDFANDVSPRRQISKRIGTVIPGDCRGLIGILEIVAIQIDEDRRAGDHRFPGIALVISIQIIKLDAVNLIRSENGRRVDS